MSGKEFVDWCAFFRQQILRDGEDSEFLDEWVRELSVFSLDDAKDAVRECVRTATKFDVPKRLLPKLLAFLRVRKDKKAAQRNNSRFSYVGEKVERSDAWLSSPQRRRLLAEKRKLKEQGK